jgi:hypothetical protein
MQFEGWDERGNANPKRADRETEFGGSGTKKRL